MSSFDAEDRQSSNDEFHDAVEAVEEDGIDVVGDLPVDAFEGVAEAGNIDLAATSASTAEEGDDLGRDAVKQEPEILCTLTEAVGEWDCNGSGQRSESENVLRNFD